NYKLPRMTSSGVRSEAVRRLLTAADIIFTAEDLADPNPAAKPFRIWSIFRTATIFVDNENPDNGPGVIIPQTTVSFNKFGPYFQNVTPNFLYEESFPGFAWASFDGTTNDPIVFPEGT